MSIFSVSEGVFTKITNEFWASIGSAAPNVTLTGKASSIEIAQLIICIPFSIIRLWTLPDGNPVGIEANVAYFGFGLIVYAIFNFLYLTVLFQSAYQVGKAFVIAIIPATAVIALMEYSVHLPSFTWLDSLQTGDLIRQLPILGIGILIYIISNILTYRVASKRFELVDL